ncbi:MAG: hypothetical protein HYY37_00050 [Candidatus Aenigmarchaeota archaeon]|nr:hypothetical protein [Candidatus Aenigmarchaeota archaeon]
MSRAIKDVVVGRRRIRFGYLACNTTFGKAVAYVFREPLGTYLMRPGSYIARVVRDGYPFGLLFETDGSTSFATFRLDGDHTRDDVNRRMDDFLDGTKSSEIGVPGELEQFSNAHQQSFMANTTRHPHANHKNN